MINLIFLAFTFSIYAQTLPQCPPESVLVEFISPVTRGKIASCTYQKDGQTVKHGEEFTFNAQGEKIKSKIYNHGVEGQAPVAAAPAALPGTEEKRPDPKEAIKDLVEILTLKKGPGEKAFKVKKCDDKPTDWVFGALLKKTITKSYSFKDHCDVQGSFSANFTDVFPLGFDLRNLQDFNRTDMKVKMSLNKGTTGVVYRFDVLEGVVKSPKSSVDFKVEYEVEIDPLTGKAHKNTQNGKITIVKVDGRPVNETSVLKFEE